MTRFNVYATVEDFKGNPTFADNLTNRLDTTNELDAIDAANEFAKDYPNQNVYIFFQNADGSTGFINPDGAAMEAVNWGN